MKKGLSLLELIIAISLLGIATLAFFSLHLFGTNQQSSSTKLTILQNEASHALEHMTKQIQKATGNILETGTDAPIRAYTDNRGIIIRIREVTPPDKWIAYRHEGSTINFYDNTTNTPGIIPAADTGSIIARRVKVTDLTQPSNLWGLSFRIPVDNNNLGVNIITCWYPDEVCPGNVTCLCGSSDNPQVIMNTNIKMPSVSSN